eukprot:gene10201-11249_t
MAAADSMACHVENLAPIVADEINEANVTFVRNAINLLEHDNTIPFIARYRRLQTGGMDAERLRHLQRTHDNIKAASNKAKKIITQLKDKLSKNQIKEFLEVRTIEEVNELYAPYKQGGKGTLAERARKLGLEVPAMELLNIPTISLGLQKFVKSNVDGLKTMQDVLNGIQHIVADIISKDKRTNEQVAKLMEGNVFLSSSTTESKSIADKEKKFQTYYDFSICTNKVVSHQILAINRGEEQKILSVKVFLNNNTKTNILQWLNRHWVPEKITVENRKILMDAIEDSFKRLIERNHFKRIRVKLTNNAEREAVEIFIKNLKKVLLASPLRGKNILAIDPGFYHGCKVVALDSYGHVLETCVIHPFASSVKSAEKKLVAIVKNNRCDIIGIGNGTACRQTEAWISDLIKRRMFMPFDIKYCIVNESGASVYSVTKEAECELPDLDPNLRSAVSIGRRLQDPLLELIKIEPKHLGVGMYQHDISDILLKGALAGVLEDCVSFVGVDLNSSSATVLKRIAGLSLKKAEAIISWRDKNGPFVNRQQLLLVKGLGKKSFEQCAGFVRVMKLSTEEESSSCQVTDNTDITGRKRKTPLESEKSSKKRRTVVEYSFEPLDQTSIHPESYGVAYRLLEIIGTPVHLIGTKEIGRKFENINTSKIIKSLDTDEETFALIVQGLKQPLGYDIRSEVHQPSFKKELQCMRDLKRGQTVSGIVSNVTSFGIFVDCGVERNGLIHKTKLLGYTNLGVGDRCQCIVENVDENRGRISLKFKQIDIIAPTLR